MPDAPDKTQIISDGFTLPINAIVEGDLDTGREIHFFDAHGGELSNNDIDTWAEIIERANSTVSYSIEEIRAKVA
ncbi:MAG: hypothetical protein ACPG8W_22005 [Candidatus Promineifilaceae bacterium]